MFVKYIGNGARPLCGSTVINKNKASHVTNEVKLKKLVDRGYEILILKDNEWIDAKEYYKEDEVEEKEKVVETNDIEVVEEEIKEDEEVNEIENEVEDTYELEFEEVDYSNLFEGHWKTQVQNVKEYSNDYKEVSNILEYAKESEDVTDGVITRVEDYLSELS